LSLGLQHLAAPRAPRQSDVAAGLASRPRSGTLAVRLLMLVAAAALPLLLLGMWTLWDEYWTQRATAERQLVEQARSLGRLVDGEFDRTVSALGILAHSASLSRGDLGDFATEMLAARATLADHDLQPKTDIRIRLLDTEGRLLRDTGLLDGSIPAATQRGIPAALAAIRTGKPQVSDLIVGPFTRTPFVVAIVPVPRSGSAQRGASPAAGGLGANIPAPTLRAILAEAALPRGAVASLHDRQGRTVAQSAPDATATGEPLPAAVAKAAGGADAGLLPDTVLGRANDPLRIAFARAEESGFVIQVAVPERTFLAPLHEGLFRSAMIGMAAMVLVLLLSLAVAQGIVSAFGRVPDLVRAGARAPHPTFPRTGLREADELADALIRSEMELHRLNQELELRVAREVEARDEANVRAARAERLQALGQLAAGIAHDINNVLQAIQGGAALIERHPGNQATVKRLAGLISEAVARGSSVTRRLLAFGRQGRLRVESVSVEELLLTLSDLLRPAIGPGIALEIAPTNGLPPVRTDKGQLETVLVNLASNGRDAMPDGGRLEIAATLDHVLEGMPAPVPLSLGRYVCLRITDTGSGMDAATLARAVEPFFTTKPIDKGAGLGLSMAKGFAEQSGGNLLIESAPNRGTTVRLWLPVAV